jgi:UPF0271 protein
MDLNADVGEGYDDAPLLPLLTSVNIACGGHAGDDETMTRTVALALRHGLAPGAHPGYPDRANFGRLELDMRLEAVTALVEAQVRRLEAVVLAQGGRLHHVKPHGALYNQAARDPALAAAIARAVKAVDPGLMLVGLAGSALIDAGREAGLAVCEEAFADRRYRADGTLASRRLPGAVIEDPALAAAQALAIARGEAVATIDGASITLRAGTLCLHGDTPGAVALAVAVRTRLEAAGIPIAAPRAWQSDPDRFRG